MDYKIEQIKELCITGIKTRTDNTKAMQVCPKVWEQFFKENTMEKINTIVPNSGLYAVYTGYESDEHGEYDFVIGAQTPKSDANDGFTAIRVPEGSYAVFAADNKEQVLPAWQQIWQTKLKRTYVSDFECYDQTTGQVKIYVGIQ